MNANELYQERRKEIDCQLIELKNLLLALDKEQQLNSNDYSYSGDITYVRDELRPAIQHLRNSI